MSGLGYRGSMSSNNGYHRCEYPPDMNGGRECEVWFPSDEGKLCILHRGIVSPRLVNLGETPKTEYIRLRNEQASICDSIIYNGTIHDAEHLNPDWCDKLDEHIAAIEKVIENERTKLLTARAKRSEALQLLSDEEREERKKIKFESSGARAPRQPKESKAEKLKATIKSDPVRYFMESLNFSREAAESFCQAQNIPFQKEN